MKDKSTYLSKTKLNFSVYIFAFLLASTLHANEEGVIHRLGLSGGFPQLVAFNYQASISELVSLEAYLGSLILINTGGARVVFSDTSPGLKPRYFAGVAVVSMGIAETPSEPIGTESYFWTGAGLGYAFENFRLFIDLGYTAEGAKDRGLGYTTGVAISGGFLFDL